MTLRNLLVENINYGFLKLMIEKIRVVTSCIVHLADSAKFKGVTSNKLCSGSTGKCFESPNDTIHVTVTAYFWTNNFLIARFGINWLINLGNWRVGKLKNLLFVSFDSFSYSVQGFPTHCFENISGLFYWSACSGLILVSKGTDSDKFLVTESFIANRNRYNLI